MILHPMKGETNELRTKGLRKTPNIRSRHQNDNRISVASVIASLGSTVETQYQTGSDSEDELLKPSDKGLPVTHGSVNGYPAQMLIDHDADINHISEYFFKRVRIRKN